MLEQKNLTPFHTALVPFTAVDGKEGASVIVKGAFQLPANGVASGPLALCDEQVKIELGDVPWGDPPDKSSLRYAAESSPLKGATDVALLGHVYSRQAREAQIDVSLRVGPIAKIVRVFGDRYWSRAVGDWRPSRPQPFDKMPLLYERAFGGWDTSAPDPKNHDFEPRNPVGIGFAATRNPSADGLSLPNLEDPRALIATLTDRPTPTGFGFVGPAWSPRRELAGTYDERWQKERCPLLPADFDARFFQASPLELQVPGHLRGDEAVTVTNGSERGPLSFSVPRRSLEITVWIVGAPTVHRPMLDTFVIEPDLDRVLCIWKATFLCPRRFLYIDLVRVRETPP